MWLRLKNHCERVDRSQHLFYSILFYSTEVVTLTSHIS
jgi:hypothetical protein